MKVTGGSLAGARVPQSVKSEITSLLLDAQNATSKSQTSFWTRKTGWNVESETFFLHFMKNIKLILKNIFKNVLQSGNASLKKYSVTVFVTKWWSVIYLYFGGCSFYTQSWHPHPSLVNLLIIESSRSFRNSLELTFKDLTLEMRSLKCSGGPSVRVYRPFRVAI